MYIDVLNKLSYILRADKYTDLNDYTTTYSGVITTEFYYPNMKYAVLTGADFTTNIGAPYIYPTGDSTAHTDGYLYYPLPPTTAARNVNFYITAIKRVLHDGVLYSTGLSYDIMLYYDIPWYTYDSSTGEERYTYNNRILEDYGVYTYYSTVQIPQMSNRLLRAIFTAFDNIENDYRAKVELYNAVFDFEVCEDTTYNTYVPVYNDKYTDESLETSIYTGPYHYEISRLTVLDLYLSLINYAIANTNIATFEMKQHFYTPGLKNTHRVIDITNVNVTPYTTFYDYVSDTLDEAEITARISQYHVGIEIAYTTAYGRNMTIDYNDLDTIKVYNVKTETYGISDDITPNFLARDFTNSKNELVTFIQTYYPDIYTDLYEHSAGSFLIDIHAYLYDIWHAYIDKAQRETVLSTMLEDNNIFDYAARFGIFLPLVTAPSTDVTFGINISDYRATLGLTDAGVLDITFTDHNFYGASPVTITDTKGNTWYYAKTDDESAVSVNVVKDIDRYAVVLPFKLGNVKKMSFIAKGETFEVVTLTDDSIDYTSIVVYVNGIKQVVGTSWDFLENKVDVLIRNNYTNIDIMFGGATYGYETTAGDSIEVVYAVVTDFDNPELNMQTNTATGDTTVTYTYNTTSVTDVTINVTANTGATLLQNLGASQTDMKQYIYARRFLLNSLSSEAEIAAYLNTYSNQYGALKLNYMMYKQNAAAYNTGIDLENAKYGDANLLLVFALIPDVSTIYRSFTTDTPPEIIKQLYTDLYMIKTMNLEFDIISGFIQQVDFRIVLNNKNVISNTAAVVDLIRRYFVNVTYGESLNLSDMLFEIETYLRATYTDIHAVALQYRFDRIEEWKSIDIYNHLYLSVTADNYDLGAKRTLVQLFGSNWMDKSDLLQASTLILPHDIVVTNEYNISHAAHPDVLVYTFNRELA